jgi:hypothetical protein
MPSTGSGEDVNEELSFAAFVRNYFALMAIVLASSFAAEHFLHWQPKRVFVVLCGGLFALAGLGWPRWVWLTVRNTGWFASIRDDSAMRFLLFALAVFLMILGISASRVSMDFR